MVNKRLRCCKSCGANCQTGMHWLKCSEQGEGGRIVGRFVRGVWPREKRDG